MGSDHTLVKNSGQYRASSVWNDLLANGDHIDGVGGLCFHNESQGAVR